MGLNFKDRANDDFDAASYVKVNDRLREFWEKFPDGAINTAYELNAEGVLIMSAKVYAHKDDSRPAGTGHSFLSSLDGEKVGEFSETVCVGRALAMMGFKVEKSIASSEEMKRFSTRSKTPAKKQEAAVADQASEAETAPQVPEKLKTTAKFDLKKIRKDSQQGAE